MRALTSGSPRNEAASCPCFRTTGKAPAPEHASVDFSGCASGGDANLVLAGAAEAIVVGRAGLGEMRLRMTEPVRPAGEGRRADVLGHRGVGGQATCARLARQRSRLAGTAQSAGELAVVPGRALLRQRDVTRSGRDGLLAGPHAVL